MEVSIILTTYNRNDDCIKCLSKLIKQDVEIILCDDWHLENNILQTFCEENNIVYIHTGSQKGGKVHWRVPGYAINIGVKRAKHPYIIIGNAEIYLLDDDLIEEMVQPGYITYPIIWDEPYKNSNITQYFEVLNPKLPFFMGMPKDKFMYIGGYDEDFTGYCFDDNDFSDRIHSILPSKQINKEALHLWNIRGAENRGDKRINKKAWNHNRKLYIDRKNIIKRNENTSWGNL